MADDMMGAAQFDYATNRWSETRAELAKAMSRAQAALAPVLKDKTNPAFKSKYADLGAVLEAILPAFNAHGLSLVQAPSNDGALVGVTTFLLHDSGEWMESTLRMKPVKADPQGIGSCITYARRYAALAIAGAAPEDDDGNAASQPRKQPRGEVGPLDAGERSNREIKVGYNNLLNGMGQCSTVEALDEWAQAWADDIEGLPEDHKASLRGEYRRRRDSLKAVSA